MWLLRTRLFAALLATALPAQTAKTSREQSTGRTDSAAIAQWDRILTEMHLSHDTEMKDVVQQLRLMNLYDNDSWINLVNTGYAYLGDSETASQFRSEL